MALMGLAIAAAIGLAKDQMIDKPADARKRKLAAETERNSPWTGQHAGPLNESNTAGTMMGYGAMGAQIGQGYEDSKTAKSLSDSQVAANNAYTDRMNSGGSPLGSGKPVGDGGGTSLLGLPQGSDGNASYGIAKANPYPEATVVDQWKNGKRVKTPYNGGSSGMGGSGASSGW